MRSAQINKGRSLIAEEILGAPDTDEHLADLVFRT